MARLSPPAGLLRVASQASGYWRARLTDWPGLVMTKSRCSRATASASSSSPSGCSTKRWPGTRCASQRSSGCHWALARAGPRVASTPMRIGSAMVCTGVAWDGADSCRAGAGEEGVGAACTRSGRADRASQSSRLSRGKGTGACRGLSSRCKGGSLSPGRALARERGREERQTPPRSQFSRAGAFFIALDQPGSRYVENHNRGDFLR